MLNPISLMVAGSLLDTAGRAQQGQHTRATPYQPPDHAHLPSRTPTITIDSCLSRS